MIGSRVERGNSPVAFARLRLVIGYRRKYLESLVRQGKEEAGKIAQEYRQASAQQEQEYAETAAALAVSCIGSQRQSLNPAHDDFRQQQILRRSPERHRVSANTCVRRPPCTAYRHPLAIPA